MAGYAYLLRVPQAEQADVLIDGDVVANLLDRADDDPEQVLDLDEWWCALHFVLTAEVPISRPKALELGVSWNDDALDNVLMGGRLTPREEARYLEPGQVARLAAQLDEISAAEFEAGYEPAALVGYQIPPGPWGEPERVRLVNLFTALVSFYRTAARRREGLVFVVP